MKVLHHGLGLLWLLALIIPLDQVILPQVSAYKVFPSIAVVPSAHPVFNGSTSLVALLEKQALVSSPNWESALRILEDLKTAPGCTQAAVRELIHACRSVSADDRRFSPDILERAKSTYGIKAALCETSEGGTSIPEQCGVLATNLRQPDSVARTGRIHDRQDIQNCLSALQDDQIYWVSYSNNRQQAAIICQASRHEIDREDALETYAQLVEVSQEVSNAQEQFLHLLQTAFDDIHTQQTALMEQQQLHQQMAETAQMQANERIQSILTNLENSTSQSVSLFATGVGDIMLQMAMVHETILGISSLATQGQTALAAMELNAYATMAEFSHVAQNQIETLGMAALRASEAIQGLNISGVEQSIDTAIHNLLQLTSMQSAQHQLASLSLNLSEQTSAKLQASSEQLDKTLSNTARLTDDIHAARTEFNEYRSILKSFFQALTALFDPLTWAFARSCVAEAAQWLMYLLMVTLCTYLHPSGKYFYCLSFVFALLARLSGYLPLPVVYLVLATLLALTANLSVPPAVKKLRARRNAAFLAELKHIEEENLERGRRAVTEPPCLPSWTEGKF